MQDDQQFNIKFVGLVEAHPCLYDSTLDEYRMSHLQERAWTEIVKNIGEGATIAECKNRWKNLRGSYTKHLKKCVASESGVSVPRPYYLAEYIGFILPFTKTRQAKPNSAVPSNTESCSSNTFNEQFYTQEILTDESSHKSGEGEEEEREEVSQYDEPEIILSNPQLVLEKDYFLEDLEKRTLSKSSVITESKLKKLKTAHVTLEDVNKVVLDYFEENKKKQSTNRPFDSANDDADVQFLLSLLPDLKKMTDRQKRKYKVGVLNLAGQILDESEIANTAVNQF
ncbi:uncharacterized protein LOC126884572 [Diabrotica virgifera virgifera]|uniref:MADF domain-containing protein n=1 Tax=Diabrotica virgifera virgifera TaxID=50390 RepID=A0ABM5K8K1_DIAVI|nr:uncharacterized protein LOC126884572 [Diabrotica virgifera virgifera]